MLSIPRRDLDELCYALKRASARLKDMYGLKVMPPQSGMAIDHVAEIALHMLTGVPVRPDDVVYMHERMPPFEHDAFKGTKS